MVGIQTKFKRQIEILGLCLDGEARFRPADLAEMFGCEELTIKRDLQELRSFGLDIHSIHRRGIRVESSPDPALIRSLVVQYLGIAGAESALDRATALLVRRQRAQALSNVVKLQRAAELSRIAVIDYVKEEGNIERGREIAPLQIFQSEGYWRVLAVNEGLIKQFHLNKVLSVCMTNRSFRRVPQERIDEMFRHSFRSWVGAEKHRVRIRLSPLWAGRIRPRQLMETESITEDPDGSVIFEATVNSLEEVCTWVVSRGAGVKVLEPEELREMVVRVARGALGNYRGEARP
ncbi:MAG: WYL domain-containing protein [Bacteroidota bacterium]